MANYVSLITTSILPHLISTWLAQVTRYSSTVPRDIIMSLQPSRISVPLLFLLVLGASLASGENADLDSRVDCHPDKGANQTSCESRGCVYDIDEPSGGTPWCYYPEDYG